MEAVFDAKNLIQCFARVRGVPVQKVLQNAAKDIIAEAFRLTPMADAPKWWKLQGRNGEWVYLTKAMADKRKKAKSKVKIKKAYATRGFSRAQWLGFFNAPLGWNEASGARIRQAGSAVKAKGDRAAVGRAAQFASVDLGDDKNPYVTLNTSVLQLKKYPGIDTQILEAGKAKALSNILRASQKLLKEAINGK